MSRKPFRWLGAAVLLWLVVLACAPQAATPPKPPAEPTKPAAAAPAAPADKRNLVVVTSADISKLDPHLSAAVNDISVSFNIFDSLTTRDPDLKLIPQLATEWKALNDTTWEFKLRPGVRFHNGDPLTSADVKFSIERTYDPEAKTSVATVFTTIDHIETPDDLTVRFVTKKPDPLMPARVGYYGGQIMPQKYFKEVGPDVFNQKPVGSGVVKFKEWVKDDRLTLEANKEYWGGAPDFDTVTFKPVPEPAARVAALLAGEADIITKVPSDQVGRINVSGKTRAEGAFYAGLYVVSTDSRVPPLDNPKVKQALSLAIDREAIVKGLWRGQGIIPNGPIAKGDFAYDPNRAPLAYDLNKAKAVLQESGYQNEPIFFETTQGYMQNDREMAEAILEMWKKLGVNVQLEQIEISVRAQKNRDKTYKGLWWSDPTSTLQDPDGMMWRALGPGGTQDYWRNPEFDRLGDEARFTLDQKLREDDYRKMTDIFLQNLPWVPIIQPIESYGVQNYLSWRPNPNQLFQLRKEVLKFTR